MTRDAFEALPPEWFTPEARRRRWLAQDLAEFQAPAEIEPDPAAQDALETAAQRLRDVPRAEWVELCRRAVQDDALDAARRAALENKP